MDKLAWNGLKWSQKVTNQDLAGILGRADLHSEDFMLFDFLDYRFLDFQIQGKPCLGSKQDGHTKTLKQHQVKCCLLATAFTKEHQRENQEERV